MSLGLQYTWLAYQLYTTLAMYAYRYGDGHALATTEQRIADRFRDKINKGEKPKVYFGDKEGVLMAELEVTFHDRVKDGQSHLQRLLFGEKQELHNLSSHSISRRTSMTASIVDQTPPSLATKSSTNSESSQE